MARPGVGCRRKVWITGGKGLSSEETPAIPVTSEPASSIDRGVSTRASQDVGGADQTRRHFPRVVRFRGKGDS